MSDTYSKIYIHIVFAVKGRQNLINQNWEEELYKYINGIISNKNQKLICINGMPDHIHILLGLKPSCCLSDLVREIKKAGNVFINTNKLTPYKFEWQSGFGAFSVDERTLKGAIHYIENQKKHHKIQSFKEEYINLLNEFKIDYQDEFLFDWVE